MGFPVKTYWFQPAEADGEWHLIREDSNVAVCEAVIIRHNVDNTADVLPTDGTAHDVCAAAFKEANR